MPVSKAVLEDLFETKLPPKPAVEDISLRDEKLGMGFPGEVFDLKCPECGAMLKLRNSKHGLFYGCEKYPACKSSHGAYDDGRPKGTPGTKATNKARIFAHRIFDRLWKVKAGEKARMTRSQAYTWMKKTMKLSDGEAHIGKFSIEQCEKLVALVQKKFPGVRNAWDKLAGDKDLF
jgi:ssDNA-binding Zn-finger/Zn-ribbon topoisomerase 1